MPDLTQSSGGQPREQAKLRFSQDHRRDESLLRARARHRNLLRQLEYRRFAFPTQLAQPQRSSFDIAIGNVTNPDHPCVTRKPGQQETPLPLDCRLFIPHLYIVARVI